MERKDHFLARHLLVHVAMRILHFATHDIYGGAARASHRLHRALRAAGLDSRMIVRDKHSDDENVHPVPVFRFGPEPRRLLFRVAALRKTLLPKPSYTFNLDARPAIDLRRLPANLAGGTDVVCLHWITDFLGVRSVPAIHERTGRPLVWILMDIEPLTGGCHYPFGCEGYTRSCGRCPLLGSSREHDWSRKTWCRKRRLLHDLPLTFVAPTSWVERRIRESSLFASHRVERIPLAVDTSVFRPAEKGAARSALGVPGGKRVVFFGSFRLQDPRKGMSYLDEALRILASRMDGARGPAIDDVLLLIAGDEGGGLFRSLPFPRVETGYLKGDERLALAYQAADLFVCPSVEDAGPMMIPESMLCGTPVVAFDAGGAPDLIETGVTGYLAKPRDSGDLARGIHLLLTHEGLSDIRDAARNAAARAHSPAAVASRYLTLFRELGGNHS